MKNFKYYMPGGLLIMLAIVILIAPEILVAFISASVIFLGIGALYLGHIMRKSESEYETVFNDTYFRSPFHRAYHSWFNNNFPGNSR
jgi:hypothetical protein